MVSVSSDVTLQLNASPGDLGYLHLTLPALVAAHRESVRKTIVVVDCCRPEKTRIVDADRRFPLDTFTRRVRETVDVVMSLKEQGWIDDVTLVLPGSFLVKETLRKYMRGITSRTHDFGGSGLVSYFVGLEKADTRYILHYDADVLLYQRRGFQWQNLALEFMRDDERIVSATPRISPPFAPPGAEADAPSKCERRPLVSTPGGWLNDWFSTRCFLMDLQRLARYMPLMQGRLLAESIARMITLRGFPLSPEIMLFRAVGWRGGFRLNLTSRDAWLIHPSRKPPEFIELLPRMIDAVARGECPEKQLGDSEINLEAWASTLETGA